MGNEIHARLYRKLLITKSKAKAKGWQRSLRKGDQDAIKKATISEVDRLCGIETADEKVIMSWLFFKYLLIKDSFRICERQGIKALDRQFQGLERSPFSETDLM